jgi:hypothetical protein
MKNHLKIISAVVLGLFLLGTTVQGSGTVIDAVPITKEDAAKKYPPPKGGYPVGEREPHMASGHVNSPYSPHQEYDCSKVGHGQLVLDTHANKVFVRP